MKNLIKSLAFIALIGSLSFGLTGCKNAKESIKKYEKELENSIENVQNQVANTTNEVQNSINNTVTPTQTSTSKLDYVGVYQTKVQEEGYNHWVAVLIKNCTDSEIQFSINAAHGTSPSVGLLDGVAKIKSNNEYVFLDEENGESNKITFKFDSKNSLTITENYTSAVFPYGGHGVYFAGTHERVTGVNVCDAMGNIYYNVKDLKQSSFIKLWENSTDGTEIAINKDGTFVIDHYTKSSERHGKYEIKGTKIYFTSDDGLTWEGELLMQQAGNNTLFIEYEGNHIYLYDGDAD